MKLREIVLDWLMSPDSAYLIGAGCSCCAGKPLIGELTQRVVPPLGNKIEQIFERLNGSDGRGATIEDLMNHLLKRRDILTSLKVQNAEPVSLGEIDVAIGSARTLIVKQMNDDWSPSDYHMRFLRRLRTEDRRPRDLFVLNYDTVLESSLEKLRLPYTDGFVGADNSHFAPDSFSRETAESPLFRLFKLHGSINWVRDEDEFVRRRPVASVERGHDPVVVYPSEQKYLQTQFGVFETLMGLFRERLRQGGPNNKLVCLGYSFNDQHINEAILDAVRQSGNNLSVYAFIGPETYQDGDFSEHKVRLGRIAVRCPERLNMYVGRDFHIGDATDPQQSEELLQLALWRFENLVQFVAGDGG